MRRLPQHAAALYNTWESEQPCLLKTIIAHPQWINAWVTLLYTGIAGSTFRISTGKMEGEKRGPELS